MRPVIPPSYELSYSMNSLPRSACTTGAFSLAANAATWVVRTPEAAAAQHGHPARPRQQRRERGKVRLVRRHGWRAGGDAAGPSGASASCKATSPARDDDDGNAALADCLADGNVEHAADLRHGGNRADVMVAFREPGA